MSSGQYSKGDVLLVDVPYLDNTRVVRRPAVIVSDTRRMLDIIIAAVTSRIRDPLPITHYVINHSHSDWGLSGLRLELSRPLRSTLHDSQQSDSSNARPSFYIDKRRDQ